MMYDIIRAVTDVDVPLEIVDIKEYSRFHTHRYKSVPTGYLVSSDNVLISNNFTICQGVCYLDPDDEVGALAHIAPNEDPDYLLTGKWSDEAGDCVEDPKEIFGDLSNVAAVHIYHKEGHTWSERQISSALNSIGIENVVHIPIKSKESRMFFWRHIIQDVNDGSVYFFPVDFGCGFKFSLANMS